MIHPSLCCSELAEFIKTNHNIVMEYHKRYYHRSTCMANAPYEIIRILFLNALSAAGGNTRLDDKYDCLCHFLKRTTPLRDEDGKVSFVKFAKYFFDKFDYPEHIIHIRHELINNSQFKQIKDKKANLFLKEIVLLAGYDVFENFDHKIYEPYLLVPIDKVVRKICHNLVPNSISNDNSTKDDKKIYDLSQRFFPESPILFDDIWFWGHFALNRGELNEPNNSMLYCDSNIDEKFISEYKLICKINTFIQIIHSFKYSHTIYLQ